MKLNRLLAISVFAALTLIAGKTAPSGLSVVCEAGPGQAGGTCAPGRVTFSGTDYSNHTHVVVTGSDGSVLDDAFYQAPGGILTFTENLGADTYTVTTTAHGGHLVIDSLTVTVN